MKNFFDILKDILLKQSGGTLHHEDGFHSHMSSFMLARYFSMKPSLVKYADKLNEWNNKSTFSADQVYLWAYHNVPKQRSGYIPYISRPKKDKKKKD